METKHTLEKILEKYDTFGEAEERRLHSAMLLAYAESLYSTVRRYTVPSPLYRLSYDETNNNVSMDEARGNSFVPREGTLHISVMDEILCANIRDIPLLLEGETGVGKTFAAFNFLATVFDSENYFSYRLSANAFLNNLFSHFQEGQMHLSPPLFCSKMPRG